MKLLRLFKLMISDKKTGLKEGYINLFGTEMKPYIDQIWDILQSSYSKIGGFLTAASKEDLMKKVWLAKCVKKGGKIIAVALFKDQFGRKSIGGGTDGTAAGKVAFYNMIKEDIKLKRSWAEVSGAIEHIKLKNGALPVPNIYAAELTGKEILSLNSDGVHYTREIGGEPHEKMIVGTFEK